MINGLSRLPRSKSTQIKTPKGPKVSRPPLQSNCILEVLGSMGIQTQNIIDITSSKGKSEHHTANGIQDLATIPVHPDHNPVMDALGLSGSRFVLLISTDMDIKKIKRKLDTLEHALSYEDASKLIHLLDLDDSPKTICISRHADSLIVLRTGLNTISSNLEQEESRI